MITNTITHFTTNNHDILTTELLELLTKLTGPVLDRPEAAQILAQRFELEHIIIFCLDPEIDVLLPVNGFPQTLPQGRKWHGFLSSCLQTRGRLLQTSLPFQKDEEEQSALGLASSDGQLVLIGLEFNKTQTQKRLAQIRNDTESSKLSLEVLTPLLPLLAAVYRQERIALNAQGYAQIAEQNANQAQNLALSLENLREDLQRALNKVSEVSRAKAETLQLLELFLANTPVGLAYFDRELRYKHINSTLASFTTFNVEDLVGHSLREKQPRLADQFEPYLKKVLENGRAVVGVEVNAFEIMTTETSTSEKPRYLLVNFFPVISPSTNNIIEGVGMVLVEITTLKELEKERFRADRLEALGVLAGGIAHDFNNLLTSILGNVSYARSNWISQFKNERTDSKPPITFNPKPISSSTTEDNELALFEAEKAVLRAKELTGQLLTFAKGGQPVRKTMDLAHLLKEVTEVALHAKPVMVNYRIATGLWPVEGDATQLKQVIQNIVINAVQAMSSNGHTLYMEASNVVLSSKEVSNLKAGEYICLSIQDEGVGIDGEIITRIFDPYFTTKKDGSGLGLAVCYSIINKHDGHIEVRSIPGKGSTFLIYLPALRALPVLDRVVEDKPNSISSESTNSFAKLTIEAITKGSGRSPKILIVDDEALIRRLVERVLCKQGYQVIGVENGNLAIEQYKAAMESGQFFNMVITDLTMPGGISGEEVAKRILEVDPKATILVSSGYSDNKVIANYRSYGFQEVITKPYTIHELQETLKRYL